MSNPGPRLATLAGTATRTRTPPSDLDRARQGARIRRDLENRSERGLDRARILQTIAREHADGMGTPRDDSVRNCTLKHGQGGGRRRLAEDPLEPGKTALRIEDRFVVDRRDQPLGLIPRLDGPIPGSRIADPNRGRDR